MFETYTGGFVEYSRKELEVASRDELVTFLELRGSACYDHEPTELLREAALDDYDSEYEGKGL